MLHIHCNFGQNTSSSIKKDFFVYFQSSIDFHMFNFDVLKKEDKKDWVGGEGVIWTMPERKRFSLSV